MDYYDLKAEIIKLVADYLDDHLALLFSNYIKVVFSPECLKLTKSFPIFKKGHLVANHWLISINPIIGKKILSSFEEETNWVFYINIDQLVLYSLALDLRLTPFLSIKRHSLNLVEGNIVLVLGDLTKTVSSLFLNITLLGIHRINEQFIYYLSNIKSIQLVQVITY